MPGKRSPGCLKECFDRAKETLTSLCFILFSCSLGHFASLEAVEREYFYQEARYSSKEHISGDQAHLEFFIEIRSEPDLAENPSSLQPAKIEELLKELRSFGLEGEDAVRIVPIAPSSHKEEILQKRGYFVYAGSLFKDSFMGKITEKLDKIANVSEELKPLIENISQCLEDNFKEFLAQLEGFDDQCQKLFERSHVSHKVIKTQNVQKDLDKGARQIQSSAAAVASQSDSPLIPDLNDSESRRAEGSLEKKDLSFNELIHSALQALEECLQKSKSGVEALFREFESKKVSSEGREGRPSQEAVGTLKKDLSASLDAFFDEALEAFSQKNLDIFEVPENLHSGAQGIQVFINCSNDEQLLDKIRELFQKLCF